MLMVTPMVMLVLVMGWPIVLVDVPLVSVQWMSVLASKPSTIPFELWASRRCVVLISLIMLGIICLLI